MQGIASYLNLERKKKGKKSPTVLQSPSLSWSIVIRCQRCWSWWHSENTKIFKVAESPDAVCSMQCTSGITEPGGHILFLPASRPGLMFAHQYLNGPPCQTHTHTHTHWVHMSVSKWEPGLGLQNDAGALVLFFALEGGVCLLQIVDHGQQPRSDALMARLRQLSVSFRTFCQNGEGETSMEMQRGRKQRLWWTCWKAKKLAAPPGWRSELIFCCLLSDVCSASGTSRWFFLQ